MDYFDTVITITGYETSKEKFDRITNDIFAQFGEYHRLFSIYHRFDGLENLRTVNETSGGAHRMVEVDRKIIDLLEFSKEMYTATDGVMNVAMGSVLSLWHDYRTIGKDNPESASLPPMQSLIDASKHTDIEDLVIDGQNCTVTLKDPAMTLDVGAVAKGYATERVAEYLEQKGITGYVLNAGGNVRAIGSKPDGEKWTVGIENPNRDGDYLAYLQLDGMSLVTSGSYQRFYYVDGKPYHHIIHPQTLMPADDYLSVSVVCKDSGVADALSTALFCLEYDKGLSLIESIDGAEAMWVRKNGEKSYSAGFRKYEK